MADLSELNFNRDAEPPKDFEPLPAGSYLAQVVDSDIKDTKNGTGKYVKLEWEIIDGEYGGRRVFAMYNIINANPTAQEIGEAEFSAACLGLGKAGCRDTEELHAIPCVIKLKVQPGKGDYGPSNRITKYSRPANAPAQQASAPASAQGGGQKDKPVWMA